PAVKIATLPLVSNRSIIFSFMHDLQAYSPLDNYSSGRSIQFKYTHLARDAWEFTIANARALGRRETHSMLTGEIDGYLTYYDIDDFSDPWKEPEMVLLHHGMGRTVDVWYGWVPILARHYRV